MNIEQPKPDSKKYQDLISEIQKGIIKVPKFQRDFVWSIDKTAKLLDSILKGYPIGTFILWQTDERINDIKNVGNLEIPPTPDGTKVQYVLDGQQRITSLFAAFLGAEIQKVGEKKITDYKNIFVNLDVDIEDSDEQVITSVKNENASQVSLSDVLNLMPKMMELQAKFTPEQFTKIYEYSNAFGTYDFSIVLLRKEDIESAIEVFTRINTGGQTLTLFEIMSAKTYDEQKKFDMQEKWSFFIKELKDKNYDSISSTVILNLLSLLLSRTKECKRKVILSLEKKKVIDNWESSIDAIKSTIDYFRSTYRIPVSQLLPYDALIVPFAYYFFIKKDKPEGDVRKYLEEFFWRMSLSYRYSSSSESSLAQDIKRIDKIIKGERPDYSDIKVYLDSSQDLIDTNFSAGNSFCKAILCLLAYQEPKDFKDNGRVILDNSYLTKANSKNYHHFFPKAYLRRNKTVENSNSLVNITLVSDHLNKMKIRAKAPSIYISEFKDENIEIGKALGSHLIELDCAGIETDDYSLFLSKRAEKMFEQLKNRIDLTHSEPKNEEIEELIAGGESDSVEFKSTLRYDLRQEMVNKKLEFVIAKTISAFLNSSGGDLFIGVDDDENSLGLEKDISTLKKQNIDGFELQLIQVLKKFIGVDFSSLIKVTYPQYDGKVICRVHVVSSKKPVFVSYEGKEEFYVRAGCSSQPLSRAEQSSYEKEHWGE